MNYFVIGQNGQKYGPADVPTLNHWVQEGRILPTTMLEDASTGQMILAPQVAGLMLASTQQAGSTYQNPTASYPRGVMGGSFDNGESELKNAWIFSIIGMVLALPMGICCSVFSLINVFGILGIVYASNAKNKGNMNTKGALSCGIVAVVLGPIIGVGIYTLGIFMK